MMLQINTMMCGELASPGVRHSRVQLFSCCHLCTGVVLRVVIVLPSLHWRGAACGICVAIFALVWHLCCHPCTGVVLRVVHVLPSLHWRGAACGICVAIFALVWACLLGLCACSSVSSCAPAIVLMHVNVTEPAFTPGLVPSC